MNKDKKQSMSNDKEQKQPLSVSLPPISMVTMNATSLELTDKIDPNSAMKKKLAESASTINIDSSENNSILAEYTKHSRSYKIKRFIENYLNLLKLVFQSIIPDLISFKWWQVLLLALYATFSVVFSVLDFNSFLPYKNKSSILKWRNDLKDNVSLWRRILLCLSGVAAFVNVLYVVLVIRGKFSSYFWGVIGAIIYGAFSFAYGYVGDAQLYALFFLPMQFIGIYMWSKELDNQSTTRVKSLKWFGWIVVILLSIGLGVVFFYEIPAFSKLLTSQYFFESSRLPHILDASTNAISVVAQFLLILCYWEQYILWLITNIMAIIMYSGLIRTDLDINLLVVWNMISINSIVGLCTWFKRWRNLDRTVRL
ncbi:unnamed protein product [Rotaria socialis]|uniref:Nicotinamide mononucleotide transporter PnuC n=2 Tax=Rotaria socialis TaxID=392032 RepID=A0A820R8W0_9BILA|nr:unnamed protein product [Rotaria socialis]CAF4434849.1 unnamed protein product [Rotaria socialis]